MTEVDEVEQLDEIQQTILLEPCPCTDCPYTTHCRNMHLACQSFALFVRAEAWEKPQELPNRKLYEEVFGTEPRPREPDRVQRRPKKRPARPRSRASVAVGATP